MANANLTFAKVATLPSTGIVEGRVYMVPGKGVFVGTSNASEVFTIANWIASNYSYAYAGGTNKFTVTPYINGVAQTAQDVAITINNGIGNNYVSSFGGQNGAITLSAPTGNGTVKLEMSGKQLQATVNGINTAAYQSSAHFATASDLSATNSRVSTLEGAAFQSASKSGSGTFLTGYEVSGSKITFTTGSPAAETQLAVAGTTAATEGSYFAGLTVNGHTITGTRSAFATSITADGKIAPTASTVSSAIAAALSSAKSYTDEKMTSAMIYRGLASVSAAPSSPIKGDFYKVSVSGTIFGVASCIVGDALVYNGSTWDKIPAGDTVVTNSNTALMSTTKTIATIDGVVISAYVSAVDEDSHTLAWGSEKTLATVAGLAIKASLPAQFSLANKFAQVGAYSTNATPAFGGTAKVYGYGQNTSGQLTSKSYTIKIPDTVATSTNDGLMPSAMWTKLNGITENAASVTYTQTVASNATAAYQIGKININGTETILYGHDANTTYDADRGISLVSGKFGHSNTPVTVVSSPTFKKVAYDAYGHITSTANVSKTDLTGLLGDSANEGTVKSVGLTMPTGFTVTGSPVTTSGTLAVTMTSGYEIPTTTKLNSYLTSASTTLTWAEWA